MCKKQEKDIYLYFFQVHKTSGWIPQQGVTKASLYTRGEELDSIFDGAGGKEFADVFNNYTMFLYS